MSKSGPRFQRANHVVADIGRALTFYRDLLGFDVAFIKDSAPDSYSHEVFDIDRNKPVRFAVLTTPEQTNVMALTEVPGLEPIAGMPRRSAIVLETPEIDTIVAGSRALGLTVYPEDHLVTKDGREGREVGIVDFDGNLVVIYLITQAMP
ncbi:MAG: VOC family protein [Hyphomonadaceae bacterium]|nr:VOC family protein [Hyphomonadaceae bacterium]